MLALQVHLKLFSVVAFSIKLYFQGMLVNDERSSWYNRVGNFYVSLVGIGQKILHGDGSVHKVSQTSPHTLPESPHVGLFQV